MWESGILFREFRDGNWEFGAGTHGNGGHDGVVHPGGKCGMAFRDGIGKKAGKTGKIPGLDGFNPKRVGENAGKWEKSQENGNNPRFGFNPKSTRKNGKNHRFLWVYP